MECVQHCPICGSEDFALFASSKDKFYGSEEVFNLNKCSSCSLIFLNPKPGPEEVLKYYPHNYHCYFKKKLSWEDALDLYLMNRRYRKIIIKERKSGKLLDIGCATGTFLSEMQKRGFEVWGLDINKEVAESARKQFGINVFACELKQADYPSNFFDIVTLWGVFEHLYELKTSLGVIRRILKPNGLLVISIPNAGCLEFKLLGEFWAGLDMPRHFYAFDTYNISLLLASNNFHILKITPFGGGSKVFALSMEGFLKERLKSIFLKDVLINFFHSFLFRSVTAPYFYLIDKLMLGSIIIVYARPQKS